MTADLSDLWLEDVSILTRNLQMKFEPRIPQCCLLIFQFQPRMYMQTCWVNHMKWPNIVASLKKAWGHTARFVSLHRQSILASAHRGFQITLHLAILNWICSLLMSHTKRVVSIPPFVFDAGSLSQQSTFSYASTSPTSTGNLNHRKSQRL